MIDPDAFAAVHDFANDSGDLLGLAPARRRNLDSYDAALNTSAGRPYRRERQPRDTRGRRPYNIIPTTPADFLAWRAANAGGRCDG
jgi:hypothetical protein